MKKLLLVFPILCLSLAAADKTSAAKKAAPSKVAAKAAPAAAKAPAKAKTTKTSTKSKKKSSKKPVTPVRSVQQHPTNERYTEIQQALVDRGYLSETNGNWDAASIAAMKKFQEDQALHPDGKLSALSLTALGLGPRRGAFVVAPMPASSTVAAVE